MAPSGDGSVSKSHDPGGACVHRPQSLITTPDFGTTEYEVYVRQTIEAGLKDSREGRTVPLAEARRRFGLEPAWAETGSNRGRRWAGVFDPSPPTGHYQIRFTG